MTEREKILARVREALKTPAPLPGSHESERASCLRKRMQPDDCATFARQWLPKVGESFDEQLALFPKNAAELKADFQLLPAAMN